MKIVCSVCNADAYKITPPWAQKEKVYGCGTCGAVLRADGEKFLTPGDLADVFRAATMAEKVFPDLDNMPPLLSAVIYTRIIEYGTQMWLDGLKQGIMFGAKRQQKE